ncbi:hypothetical protein HDU67_002371, partial [Dinochytrium kinnereticum]
PSGVVCCGTGAAFGATYCPAGGKCVETDKCEVDGVIAPLPNTYKAAPKKSLTIAYGGAATTSASAFAVAAVAVAAAML